MSAASSPVAVELAQFPIEWTQEVIAPAEVAVAPRAIAAPTVTYQGIFEGLVTINADMYGASLTMHVEVEPDLQAIFNRLADTWQRETVMLSRLSQRSMHWAYQQVIGMGPPAVRFMLERLRDDGPDDWFWALSMITREDAGAGTTTLRDATERWLAWGRVRQLI
jgi:hypothetical protein